MHGDGSTGNYVSTPLLHPEVMPSFIVRYESATLTLQILHVALRDQLRRVPRGPITPSFSDAPRHDLIG